MKRGSKATIAVMVPTALTATNIEVTLRNRAMVVASSSALLS